MASLTELPNSGDPTLQVSAVEKAGGKTLRLVSKAGQRTGVTWPGVSVAAPGGSVDLSKYGWVKMDVSNIGESPVTVVVRVKNRGGGYKMNSNTARRTVPAGECDTICVPLRKRMQNHNPVDLGELSLAYPLFSNSRVRTIDPRDVTRFDVLLYRPYPTYPFACEVGPIYAGGEESVEPAVYQLPKTPFPFIDGFGQFMYDEWDGKVKTVEDLARNRETEAADLKAHPQPSTWSHYGGWAGGPRLAATGHFRTEKHKGKWWLVDPEGCLFFSLGVNGLNMWSCTTQLEGRKHWFSEIPGRIFKTHLRETPFRSKAVDGDVTNVLNSNLELKYGTEWQRVWVDVTLTRLRSWGINTVGQGAQPPFYQAERTAYTFNIHSGGRRIEASSGPWSKFPDVFDPSFERSIRATLRSPKLAASVSDPWCIGYFSDNELAWGGPWTIGVWVLRSPPVQLAKKVFAEDLKEKYADDIAALNQAWKTDFGSWQEFLDRRQVKMKPGAEMMLEDIATFSSKTIEQYFRVCHRAIKAEAPHKLYLGVRFAGEVRPEVVDRCAEYCDVVSYNLYKTSIEGLRFPTEHDKPLMATEFNVSCVEPRYFYSPGYLHGGLMTHVERARGFGEYVAGALRDPRFVGCHWHRYMDDPPSGNLIGENGQWGFIDITDTPYPHMRNACRSLAETMFRTRLYGFANVEP
jgi:hypothetical protein